MPIIEQHTTPDGLVIFYVDLTDGDWTIGFEGFPGHTHGDILAELNGGTPEDAVRAYVDEVIGSQRVIVISRINGVLNDAWVADGPIDDALKKYAYPNETFELRYWNGESATV
jgi:hypothetical protein